MDESRPSDEGRSSDKAATPHKSAAEARTPNKSSAESTTADARAAESATTAEATTTKSRLGRSRDQYGADHGHCRESGEFLVDHGLPPLDASPQ
jgi:hypothetical protein